MTNMPMQARFHYKKALIIAGAAVLLLLCVLAFLMRPAYAASTKTLSFVKDTIARQQKIEQEIRAAYQAGEFSFTAPLVIQDPYQTAPLTALIIFDTPEDSQISIHVPGKSLQAAVDYPFPGYQQHHEIPIYGLYADALNHVTMRMKTHNGESAHIEVDLQTEPLPVFIKNFTIDTVDRTKYNPGFNFTLMDRKPVFDIDGDVRWYSSLKSWEVFTNLKNGRFLFTYSEGGQEGDVLMEEDLLGKIYAIYNIADGIHHDIYELPTGNLLITSADIHSKTIEDYIIEIDRKSGHIVRSHDLKDILDPGRPHQVEELAANDWLHLNSIVYDPGDHSIIISSKAQSAVGCKSNGSWVPMTTGVRNSNLICFPHPEQVLNGPGHNIMPRFTAQMYRETTPSTYYCSIMACTAASNQPAPIYLPNGTAWSPITASTRQTRPSS
jgi:hypothetical protein